MRFKSFIRSIASLSLSSLVLLAALACPALVQSDEAAPDIKTAFSKLSVTPKSLSYNVNINKGVFSETKHFHITNEGTVPLKVVVNTPSNPAYVVRSGGGTTTIPGKVKGSKAEHLSTVDVEFIPNGSVKSENGTIGVISDATSGKKIAIVALNGRTKKGGGIRRLRQPRLQLRSRRRLEPRLQRQRQQCLRPLRRPKLRRLRRPQLGLRPRLRLEPRPQR